MRTITIKQLYAADDIAIIREALEHYADTLEETAKDLTGTDEKHERDDALRRAYAARILSGDFE